MFSNRKKAPVAMQMETLECGAASLVMILAYHGKWIPLERARRDCGVSRDGAKASNVLKAARAHGLDARGFRGGIEDLKKKKGVLPCIIHWNYSHFVVLTGITDKYAYINDPASGALRVAMEEFGRAFSGVYLTFEKTAEFKPEGRPQSVWEFARKRLKGTLAPFVFVTVTGVLTAVFGVVNPVLSRVFVDRVLAGVNAGWFLPVIFGMSAVVALSTVVGLVNIIYLYKIRGKLAIVANASFLWHVLRLPMEFFSQRMAGDIAQRQESNETVAETLMRKIAPILLDAALTVFYLTVMIRYSPLLTLIGVGSIAIQISLAAIISQRRMNIARVQMRDGGRLAAATVGGIEMIETIKSAGAENGYFARWAGFQASLNAARMRFMNVNLYLGALPELVMGLTNAAVLVVGVFLIMQGKFTAGMLLAFQGFLLSLRQPARELIDSGQTITEMRVLMERIEDVMKYPAEVSAESDENTPESLDKLTGNIEVKNVSFGYSPLEPPLIENVSISIKPGSSVAIVGRSGCGKSTLAKLLTGLYKPWSGEILFDGKSMDEIGRRVFTSSVAAVDQEITVFEDSAADNIRMWDKSIEDFEVIMACRDAGIHNDIVTRPDGYANTMTEGGRNFSGGQLQRIEIARALAGDPTILVMDEATSALDAKTEYEVTRAIRDRGITCVIIAHRLSAIRDCDEIIALDKGKIIERGTHDELMKSGGHYAGLVMTE